MLLALGLTLAGCRSTRKPTPYPKALPARSTEPYFVVLPAPSSTEPRAPLPSREACWLDVRGALNREITGTYYASSPALPMTDVQASSDYWSTDADLGRVIGARVHVFATDAEARLKLDHALASDPRQMILRLSCLTDAGGVILMTGNRSHYRDIPFGPGHYRIGSSDMARAVRGEFVAQTVRIGRLDYYKTQTGELQLSRFDQKGAAGSFTLTAAAVADESTITVSGRFDFPCDPLDASLCEPSVTHPDGGG